MEEGWFEGGEEGAVAASLLVGASLGAAGDGAPVRAGEETAAPPPALSSSLRDRGLLSLQSPDLPNPAPLSPPAPAEDRIAACFAAARAAWIADEGGACDDCTAIVAYLEVGGGRDGGATAA